MIEGDVDFIFGSAQAIFNQCIIKSMNRYEEINGFVTASSTWEHEKFGFIFVDCHFTCEEGTADGSVYLGRPWRPHAKVRLVNCRLGSHFHRDLWDYWGDEKKRETVRFEIYYG